MKINSGFALLIIITLLNAGCKKTDNKDDSKAYSDSIKGAWELRYVIGIQVPGANPNFNPGNGNIWQFNDTAFQYYGNGQLLDNGSYSLIKDTALATGQLMDALILKHDTTWPLPFEIGHDTLTIYRGIIAADGSIEKYVRIESLR